MTRAFTVIGVPCGAGAHHGGLERGPAALRAAGLLDRPRQAGCEVSDAGDLAARVFTADRTRHGPRPRRRAGRCGPPTRHKSGAVLAASWVGGQLGAGVISLAIMAAFGLFFLLVTGRSETIRGLTTGRDERFAQIDLKATAVAGLVLIITLIVAWLVDTARGHDGSPYDWLAAVGGLAYALAIAFFRWRG